MSISIGRGRSRFWPSVG